MNERRKWLVLGFAFLATVINYFDRQTLSVMAPIILEQLHISPINYSRIIFAFMLAYTLMNGISGRLLDILGSRIGYSVTIAWWSLAEILHAFSRGVLSLGMFRFLLGVGEAGNYPAGVKLIAEWFPAQERSLASGIFNSGASVGAIIAPPVLAWIVLTTGWRTAFIAVGLLGLVWFAVWLIVYAEPQSQVERTQTARVPLKILLGTRFLWQFTLSKIFSDPVWYFYIFWVPEYLKVAHHFTMRQIGETAWIPFFTAAIGNLAGGVVFSVTVHFGATTVMARRIAVLFFSTLMVGVVLMGLTNSPAICLLLISMATFGYSGALANLLAVPSDVFPKESMGSSWGFASMGSGFGGMIFSLITGWLVSRYSYRPAFVLFGILPIVAAWLVWTLPKSVPLISTPNEVAR
jgi:ACS family hexuronate transporter-like MFS transporter